MHKET